MSWYDELGFDENPFGIDPDFSARSSVGLEKQLGEIEYYISSGSMVFVEGPPGSGKSVLLRKLADKLGSKAVWTDASQGVIDLRSVVRSKTSFFDRILGRQPKNIVLMIDNAPNLPPAVQDLLKYYYDNNYFGSVILAGPAIKSADLLESVLDRIGSRVVRLAPLAEDEAVLIVRQRLGSSSILGDDLVRKIYKLSGKNAKRFLQLCESACVAAVASNSSTVKEEHLRSSYASLKNTVGGLNG